MSEEILKALGLLSTPGQVIEVRAITDDGIASGYFDDPVLLTAAVDPLDSLSTVQGIYLTLNEVNPALLSRRANRIKQRLGKKDTTTADADILRRRWFPIDIDPARPSGVSSTDQEHQRAIETAGRIADHLAGLGWPAPVIADSGNGAHLLYRIELANDDHSRDLVRQCLEVLATLFDDPATSIDTANYNAARIWKLYGTMSRKGDHTTDRPHRRSRLLTVPEVREVVPPHLLEALARTLPKTPPAKKNGHAINLAGWLRDHGIGIAREKPYQGGTLFVLDECPFSGAHRDGAFAIQFSNGAIHAGCQHTSCGGGSQRWTELREKYEGERAGGEPSQGTRAKTRKTGTRSREDRRGDQQTRQNPEKIPADTPDPVQNTTGGNPGPLAGDDLPGRTQALEILQHGDPKQAMLKAFALDHVGDTAVAECLILSLASRFVANTNGLHVSVTGESGKGKSHAFSTLLRQVPPRFRLEGAMSNKALFYLEDLQAGSVIVLDDRALSEEMAEILKGVTTSFRTPFLYRTVSKDRKAQVCTIPERCVWWVAKVEGAGDDQVFNRMLTCWIDDSEEQDARVLARVLAKEGTVPDTEEEERPEVLTCQVMWDLIGQQLFHVVIPFAEKIRFMTAGNRRNPEMLLDLVKAHCVLCYQQRQQDRSGSLTFLEASREDFEKAARLYQLLNGIAGGQETKLTRRESDLIEAIQNLGHREFTIPDLQKATGWSSGNLHKYLHGHISRGKLYCGLMEKCPAIAYTDRTVVTEEQDCVSMRRRTNAYTFDPDLYVSWNSGGGVWLDDDPDNTSTDFNNTSTPVEVLNNELKGSDLKNKEFTINMCTATEDHFNKNQDTQESGDTKVHAGSCISDPESVEVKDTNPGYFEDKGEKSPEIAPITLQPSLQQDPSCRSVEGQKHPDLRINPRDYKPLEIPDHTFCRLCGNAWTHYVEKLTGERKRRTKDQWQPYQICKKCYARAKKRAQQSATFLPGTCDSARMERLTTTLCRCTICELDAAVYIDRSTGTKLCETCYQRITGSSETGQVIG